jgi:hypothetical protein
MNMNMQHMLGLECKSEQGKRWSMLLLILHRYMQ